MSKKKLGFGLMRLPLTDPNDDSSIDLELLKQMVDAFLERGFTYFDTAWMYCGGKSEEAAREAAPPGQLHPDHQAARLHAAQGGGPGVALQ